MFHWCFGLGSRAYGLEFRVWGVHVPCPIHAHELRRCRPSGHHTKVAALLSCVVGGGGAVLNEPLVSQGAALLFGGL